MLRRAVVFVALLACVPGSAAALIGASPDTDHDEVVMIVDGTSICTGVAIAPRRVLTALHCVDGESPEVLVGPDSSSARRIAVDTVDTVDRTLDIALITVDEDLGVTHATIAPPPVVGDQYLALGYGRDQSGVSGVRRALNDQQVVCVGPPCSDDSVTVLDGQFIGSGGPCAGDSGGPAFGPDGGLLGIVVQADDGCSAALYSTVFGIDEVAEERGGCGGQRSLLILLPLWMTAVTRAGRRRTR